MNEIQLGMYYSSIKFILSKNQMEFKTFYQFLSAWKSLHLITNHSMWNHEKPGLESWFCPGCFSFLLFGESFISSFVFEAEKQYVDFQLGSGWWPNPVVQESVVICFFPRHFPSFPLAWLCSCALLFQTLYANETIHREAKPWPSSFQFLPGPGTISSGTRLLWAPKMILLSTCPLIHKWSYLDLLDSHRTNFKLRPGVCRPTQINPKCVHLVTFFILSQASVICSLLALVCAHFFFSKCNTVPSKYFLFIFPYFVKVV